MSKTYVSSLILALTAVLLTLAPPAAAQKKQSVAAPAPVTAPAAGIESIGKGDMEFGIFANYTTYDDVDSDFFLLGASVGQFITDSLAMKVTPVISLTEGGGSTSFNFSPFFSLEKLFRGAGNRNPVVPYIGGGIGLTLGYSDCNTCINTTTMYGLFVAPVGGVKFFLSERASLELALSYQVGFIEISSGAFSTSADTKTVQQNIRFNFYY